MEWWQGAKPVPKKSNCKNPPKKSRLDFLGSRLHPSLLLSSKGPNNQRGELLISVGVIEGHFEGKTRRECH